MKKIFLGPDMIKFAMVDDRYYDILSQYHWYTDRNGYAMAYKKGEPQRLRMHRFVYELEFGSIPKEYIDHKDRDKLNNQIENLRPASALENSLNQSKRKSNPTGYSGVRQDKRTGRFQVHSSWQGHQIHIGYFDTARKAGIAHDIFRKANHPHEFLNLNVPDASDTDIEEVRTIMSNPKQRKGSSEYLGVILFDYDQRRLKWESRLSVDDKDYRIGYFLTEEHAALARDYFAIRLMDNPRLNFPNPTDEQQKTIELILAYKEKRINAKIVAMLEDNS